MKKITHDDKWIYLYTQYHEKDKAASLPGARWTPQKKCWRTPATPECALQVRSTFGDIADEPLRHLLAVAKKRQEVLDIANSGHVKVDYEYVMKPWDHQVGATLALSELDAAVFNGWMGAGKTAVTFNAARKVGAEKVLVVCPTSVIQVWQDESEKHCFPDEWRILGLTGSIKKRAEGVRGAKPPFFAVINYEAIWRKPMAETLKSVDWDVIVYDEVQRIKGLSKQSRFAAQLRTHAKQVWALTGTLMPHSPLDIYAIYRALDPGIFGTSYGRFKHRYADVFPLPNGGEIVNRYVNLDDLRNRIDKICYHVPKEKLDLPPLTQTERYCEMGKDAARAYRELEQEFITEIDEGIVTASNALAKLLRLQQVASGFVHTEEKKNVKVGDHKLNLMRELLDEEVPKGEKVVIFARFIADLDMIQETCAALDLSCGRISGGHNDYEGWKAGEFDVMAVQIQAGGLGIDLSDASYCMFFSHWFSLGDTQQALARVHRTSNDSHVHCIRLVTKGTVDEKIIKALDGKRSVIKFILEDLGAPPEVADEAEQQELSW